MANATYDALWNESMAELSEQLHVEGVDDLGDSIIPQTPKSAYASPEVTIYQAFQHFACLYIKYLQIFRKLENCYDNMIHPQKRIHVKKVLELVIRRIIELKNDLVKWNPPNSHVKIPQGPEEAFPWEYVHLDDILVDLKLSPETLEIPIPRYFKDDNVNQITQRDRLVSGYMRLKHNTDEIFITDQYETPAPIENMTIERAIEVIQRNERGRQGLQRANLLKESQDGGMSKMLFSNTTTNDKDSGSAEIAVLNIQRSFKGFIGRSQAIRERENELMFIGMKNRKDNVEILTYELNMAHTKRKQEQLENKALYEQSLEDLKEIIMDEEGPEKKDELREERTLWVTDQIAQEKFPETLDEFYAAKFGLLPDDLAETDGKNSRKGKKPGSSRGSDRKSEAKSAAGSKKGGKGKAKGAEVEERAMPKLQGKTELTEKLAKYVDTFEKTWENRDESNNFQQRHDVNLAKDVVRPSVYDELRKQVDEMLIMNLKKIKLQMEPTGKKKKGKGKKGKKKGKKGKKGKKKGKKGKKKPLPGEKLAEMKGLDTDQMLSVLIDYQLIVRARNRSIKSLVGDFNYLGSMHHNSDRRDEGSWEPQDPSIAQLRQSLTEYCILPNGSLDVKMDCNPIIKSVMLYGPSGTGKTHAVEAVANELGALLIHLSPTKLKGLFQGKTGPTKLVHMVMTVARDPTMQPVVIYIDECEQFFTGGSGKKSSNKDKDSCSRFKKDFLTYKNQALTNEHRVIIIGTSSKPENGDLKDFRSFFDKYLFFPYPDYSSRLLVWNYYIEKQLRNGIKKSDIMYLEQASDAKQAADLEENLRLKIRLILDRLDVSSLASVSEGYSAGAIARTVRSIVTMRRVAKLRQRPLNNVDFIDDLALQDVSYKDDRKTFLLFTRAITGLDERRKKIEAIISGEKDKKKGKKGKKGKGGK